MYYVWNSLIRSLQVYSRSRSQCHGFAQEATSLSASVYTVDRLSKNDKICYYSARYPTFPHELWGDKSHFQDANNSQTHDNDRTCSWQTMNAQIKRETKALQIKAHWSHNNSFFLHVCPKNNPTHILEQRLKQIWTGFCWILLFGLLPLSLISHYYTVKIQTWTTEHFWNQA